MRPIAKGNGEFELYRPWSAERKAALAATLRERAREIAAECIANASTEQDKQVYRDRLVEYEAMLLGPVSVTRH